MSIYNLYKQYKKENKAELYFIILFLTIWSPTTINYIAVFLEKITGIELLKLAFPYVLTVLLILLSFRFWIQKIRSFDFILYIVIVGLCILNYLFDRTNIEMQNLFLPMFIKAFMCIFAGIAINMEKLKVPLYYISVINIFLVSFYYLIFTQSASYSGSIEDISDSANAHIGDISYQILPSVLYVIWICFKEFKFINIKTIVNILSSILGFILISSFGTRGPMVCIVIFIIAYVFFFYNQRNKTLIRVLTLLIGVIFYMCLGPILLYMAALMQSLGMSSRIFSYALEGTFMGGEESADGRLLLFDEAKAALEIGDVNTWFGYGFLGWSKCISGYPHNFYYDVMISFGYIFGAIFILWLAILFLKTIKASVPNDWKCIVLVVSMVGFVQLFMSGTFWGVPFFYLLIGLCLNIIRKDYITVK